ncbi:GNAT family N-acetyltransferase [Aeromonas rivipollensis]|uniref:GNAT family N-acetyltransferase n=1 Tax=Aeromonas rivipollensis TaxID=948519 RepID=UPI000D13D6E7|nr:GNAT family N-acetyltransferase [Aeromonas rivipollensis]AVP94597.1 GNAT family N-acetyltransferase [Aeromonas rivipollensis]
MPQTQNTATARIIPLSEQHIPALLALFEQSVRRLGPEHYSSEQVEQWAQGARHPGLASQLREHHGWVMEQEGSPLGFVTLSDDGHLSLLYVSADHQRQGLGGLLLAQALQAASQLGLHRLTTEASAFSLALFLRHGFEQAGLETVERGGVSFVRHRLYCRLPSQGQPLKYPPFPQSNE